MPKFIKAKDEDEREILINLDNVTWVLDSDGEEMTTVYFAGDTHVHVEGRAQQILDQASQ